MAQYKCTKCGLVLNLHLDKESIPKSEPVWKKCPHCGKNMKNQCGKYSGKNIICGFKAV